MGRQHSSPRRPATKLPHLQKKLKQQATAKGVKKPAGRDKRG